ncbi:hypothetical protein F4778DRAFT_702318 [Xylariomycetidae sp. FL2044]|nr:hypothetical protein F4778DRAFT_702318 [Xylariomycetidae sp. FL2044]
MPTLFHYLTTSLFQLFYLSIFRGPCDLHRPRGVRGKRRRRPIEREREREREKERDKHTNTHTEGGRESEKEREERDLFVLAACRVILVTTEPADQLSRSARSPNLVQPPPEIRGSPSPNQLTHGNIKIITTFPLPVLGPAWATIPSSSLSRIPSCSTLSAVASYVIACGSRRNHLGGTVGAWYTRDPHPRETVFPRLCV